MSKEFKFSCPSCGQHIQAAKELSGRQIDCPACKKPIFIPPPRKQLRKGAPAPSPQSARAKPPAAAPADQTRAAKPARKTEAPSSPNEKPERHRISVLTPTIKLEMVRAVRRRIADESAWLPGRLNGANAYAAAVREGEPALVNVNSPGAKRFSLIGAFLLEFHLRKVVRTAPGRAKLLDHEIPDAVREVLLDEMSDEEREETADLPAKTDVMSISHAQCLATLDVLEERYSQRMDQARAEKARRRLGKVRLPDLVRKLERKARIAPDEVATALCHELMDVQKRLDRLESELSRSKTTD